MYITKEESQKDKKKDQKTAFYIDEDKFPDEAKLWEALGFNGVQDAYKKLKNKQQSRG